MKLEYQRLKEDLIKISKAIDSFHQIQNISKETKRTCIQLLLDEWTETQRLIIFYKRNPEYARIYY